MTENKVRATARERLDADLVAAVKAARASKLNNEDVRVHLTELLDTLGGVLR